MKSSVSVCEPSAADLIIQRLEAAGETLMRLRFSGFSTGMRTHWPAVIHDFFESYGNAEIEVRPAIPDARAISEMDEAFAWLASIPQDRYVLRRIVGLRALVNPSTGRHLFTWRQLGRVMGADYRAVQKWHGDGIGLMIFFLSKQKNPVQSDQNMRAVLSHSQN